LLNALMKLCVIHYSKEWSFPGTEELVIHNRHSFHYAFICTSYWSFCIAERVSLPSWSAYDICALKKDCSYEEISVDDPNPILSESWASSLHKL